MQRAPLVFLIVSTLLFGATSVAQAATVPFHGKAWKKGSKVRVYSALGARYDRAVDVAIANYAPSRTGARIGFTRVTSKRRAQVVVRTMNDPRMPVGVTDTQGFPGRRQITVRLNLRLGGFERQTKGYTEDGTEYLPDPYAATMLIAHELGHVIGLDHTRASVCSIANPGFFRACENRGESDFWGTDGPRTFSCDFVQRADARTLASRYGGKAKNISGTSICRMDDGTPYTP